MAMAIATNITGYRAQFDVEFQGSLLTVARTPQRGATTREDFMSDKMGAVRDDARGGDAGGGRVDGLARLAALPGDAPIEKQELAEMFDVSGRTLQRWVDSEVLPPPVPMGRKKLWTAGQVRSHIVNRAERIAAEARARASRRPRAK